MQSFRYAGGCRVRCPHSKKGGVLTGGLLSSTGGVTGLLVTGVSSFRSFLISPDGDPPPGGFALADLSQVLEVVAPGLAMETVDALLLMEVVFHLLPSALPAARPLHTLAHVAVAHVLLSASWAPTTGGGFSHCIWASPIRFQASLILDGHLS